MKTIVVSKISVVYSAAVAILVLAGVLFFSAASAPSRAVPSAKWEYRQLAPTADFAEWNRLGQEGWEFAGTFERAVIFKRNISAQ